MKKLHLIMIFLIGMLFTSCTVMQTPSNARVDVSWDGSYYDFDQIHFLYTNNPQYFWNYQYVNNFGVNMFYYQHPYFIQYRRDCVRRNVQYRPYRRYDNRVTVNNNNRRTINSRGYRGRSNQDYRNSSTNRNNGNYIQSNQRKSTSVNSTRTSTPIRSNYRSSTPTRNTNVQRSSATQRTRSATPNRSSGNRGRSNQ
jgi:hypothetical protein